MGAGCRNSRTSATIDRWVSLNGRTAVFNQTFNRDAFPTVPQFARAAVLYYSPDTLYRDQPPAQHTGRKYRTHARALSCQAEGEIKKLWLRLAHTCIFYALRLHSYTE